MPDQTQPHEFAELREAIKVAKYICGTTDDSRIVELCIGIDQTFEMSNFDEAELLRLARLGLAVQDLMARMDTVDASAPRANADKHAAEFIEAVTKLAGKDAL